MNKEIKNLQDRLEGVDEDIEELYRIIDALLKHLNAVYISGEKRGYYSKEKISKIEVNEKEQLK